MVLNGLEFQMNLKEEEQTINAREDGHRSIKIEKDNKQVCLRGGQRRHLKPSTIMKKSRI